jgi:hypothetical protein
VEVRAHRRRIRRLIYRRGCQCEGQGLPFTLKLSKIYTPAQQVPFA